MDVHLGQVGDGDSVRSLRDFCRRGRATSTPLHDPDAAVMREGDTCVADQLRELATSRPVNQAWTAAEMKLASKDGQMFEMRIVGYQFPHLETVEYDSNWLIIAGEVIHPNSSWRFSDPCLLTYEGKRLASWMESIAEGEPVESICGFIEPNLQFRAVLGVGLPVLRVYFELEARPKWAPKRAPKGDLWVEFPVEEIDLRSAARRWRAELSAFPQRAAR